RVRLRRPGVGHLRPARDESGILAEVRQAVPGSRSADPRCRGPLQRRREARRVPRTRAQLLRREAAGAAALFEREMSVGVIAAARDFRRGCQEARRDGELALVPTMGYLHAGHQSLIQAAAQRAPVAVTIFVDPTPLGAADDL